MARYLITGGAGFIGSHLCEALVDLGHDVTILDDFSSGRRSNIAHLGNRIEVIEGEVSSGALTKASGNFDALIHLAALISGYDSLVEPDAYIRANVNGLVRVVDFVAERGVPRIVFASSSTVYGDTGLAKINETVTPKPITVYAASKLMGEHLLAVYGKLRGFTHCSLRFFNVYGPRQAVDHPYANVTCKFSHSAANGLPIDLYGDGEQSRDFVYVADVVRSLLLVLESSPSPVYNVGTGRQTSIKSLIETLGELTGEQLTVRPRPAWPNDVRAVAADTSRAKRELGFSSSVTIDEGLGKTVDFFRTD